MSEEDIKILEELILYYEAEAISRKFIGNLSISVNEDDIQAIENLLKGYREKEEIIEKLNKNTLDFSNTVIKDFIPKSKVKEKIEKLEKAKQEYEEENTIDEDYYFDINGYDKAIWVLQEIMEGE